MHFVKITLFNFAILANKHKNYYKIYCNLIIFLGYVIENLASVIFILLYLLVFV